MITGASGAGKSALALQLIALGAELVADDRTELWREGGKERGGAGASQSGESGTSAGGVSSILHPRARILWP